MVYYYPLQLGSELICYRPQETKRLDMSTNFNTLGASLQLKRP